MKKLILLSMLLIPLAYSIQVGGPGHDNGEVLLDTGGVTYGPVEETANTPPKQGGGNWKKEGADLYYDVGNIGIGTNIPNAKLVISKDDSKAANMLFQNVDTGNEITDGLYVGIDANERGWIYNNEKTDLVFGTNASLAFIIDKNKNIGIGLVAPTAKLEIKGGATIENVEAVITEAENNIVTTNNEAFVGVQEGAILTANGKDVQVLEKIDDNTILINEVVNWNNKGDGYPFVYQNPILKVNNEKSPRLFMNAKGHLGLGDVNAPEGMLHARGLFGTIVLTADSGDGDTDNGCEPGAEKVFLNSARLAPGYVLARKRIVNVGEDYVCIEDNAIEWKTGEIKDWYAPHSELVLKSDGAIGIGTTLPSAKIEMAAPPARKGAVNLITDGESQMVTTENEGFAKVIVGAIVMANGETRSVIAKPDNNTLNVNFSVDWSNFGEGYAFTYKNPLLNINNDQMLMRADGHIGIGTDNPGSRKLKVVGDFEVTGSCSGCGADRNLKKNVVPLEGALGKVLLMQGISFEWDDDTEEAEYYPGNQLGVDAQDLEDIYPELVGTDARGYKFIHYKKLAVPLIEAVKEQQAEIELLKEQIAILTEYVKYQHPGRNKDEDSLLEMKHEGKVTVCHYPRRRQGNRNKPRTITISEAALEAHLSRGNIEGDCEEQEEE